MARRCGAPAAGNFVMRRRQGAAGLGGPGWGRERRDRPVMATVTAPVTARGAAPGAACDAACDATMHPLPRRRGAWSMGRARRGRTAGRPVAPAAAPQPSAARAAPPHDPMRVPKRAPPFDKNVSWEDPR